MSESGPGRHLNQPVMSAPSHPIHLYISGCSAEKSALHNAVQDGKDAAVHWNSGVQTYVQRWDSLHSVNQALVGRGRVDRGQCWAGASFHCWPCWAAVCWPCWAAVCRIGRRASSVPTSSRSATGPSSGRVDDGRHQCFIVPCVPEFHVHHLIRL